MRVTPAMTADNALFNLQQGRSKLDKIQEQVASGVIVNRPSDDPIASRQILDLENKVKEGGQYLSNITKGNLWLNVTDTTLTSIGDIIDLAKKNVNDVSGTSTTDPTQSESVNARKIAAEQLRQLKNQLVDLGNTELQGQYIFAGFYNDTKPFNTDGTLNVPGTSGVINTEIDAKSYVQINYSGDKLLRGGGGGANVFTALDNLINEIDPAINQTAGVPDAMNVVTLQNEAKNLEQARTQVSDARSEIAGRMTRMQSAENILTRNKSTLTGLISDMQNVDYIKAATELNQQQTAFQAALSATAKITQLSLLDYLK
ncbi:MAG: flagellar hook-associated protein 3 [Geobacteraceae bacterium]|nr:MAG: flagellar hook-associated protein 3 [Geobacteraceae bacterium]